MRAIVLILLICVLAQTTAFGELTKDDLEAIQKVVQAEIAASEQRTSTKLAAINTEIKVIQTDIKGVKDRLRDTHGTVIAVIGLIGGAILLGTALTYAAAKIGSGIADLRKLKTSNDQTNELLKQNTKARNEYTAEVREVNNRLRRQEQLRDEQNVRLANMQKAMDRLNAQTEELKGELTDDPTEHAPAD